jgi:hypothetical protein
VKWTERSVAGVLARNSFDNALCVLPNAGWAATAGEVDMLVVPPCMRVIDVEIKVSRADLKADAKKDKWWRRPHWDHPGDERQPLEWPKSVWKHYYALPAEIWKPELLAALPSPASGVLLVHDHDVVRRYGWGRVSCERRAKPNRDAEPIKLAELRMLARLTSLRMWDAYREVDVNRQQVTVKSPI